MVDQDSVQGNEMSKDEPQGQKVVDIQGAAVGVQKEQGAEQSEGKKSEEEFSASHHHIEVSELRKELDELKDRYLRAAAEQENLRRRWEKEKGDLRKFGSESLLKDLLPVLDSFEQALSPFETMPEEDDRKGFVSGFQMLKKQFFDVLGKHGVEAVTAAGQGFDPNLHQAIQMIESADVESQRVHQEFQRGYLLNGRLVRPAMVSVAVPASAKSGDS